MKNLKIALCWLSVIFLTELLTEVISKPYNEFLQMFSLLAWGYSVYFATKTSYQLINHKTK
jgi:hypothetical protein